MNKKYYLALNNGYLSKAWSFEFISLSLAKQTARERKEKTGEQQTIFIENEYSQYITIETI